MINLSNLELSVADHGGDIEAAQKALSVKNIFWISVSISILGGRHLNCGLL